jgi:hypothetical protein
MMMMMMICLRVQKIGCGILGQCDCDAYATIDDDIVMAEIQTDQEIAREMRSNDRKDAEEPDYKGKEEEGKVEVSFSTLSEALGSH